MPLTYEKNGHASYFRDLAWRVLHPDDDEVRERFRCHAADVAASDEAVKLGQVHEEYGPNPYVPPLWMLRMFQEQLPKLRPYVAAMAVTTLPPGTDSISVPTKFGANLPKEDYIEVPVRAWGGQQGVAMKLLESSPVMFDEIVARDLLVDYVGRISAEVVAGVRGVAGIHQVKATGVSRDAVYEAVSGAIGLVHNTRYLRPTHIVMHPRRHEVFEEMFSDAPFGDDVAVIADPAIPTTLGDNRDEDVIHVLRAPDSVLWESGLRARALTVDGGDLVLQIYAYSAFCAARYPMGIAEISGLGAVP